jgi:hypothetical protein
VNCVVYCVEDLEVIRLATGNDKGSASSGWPLDMIVSIANVGQPSVSVRRDARIRTKRGPTSTQEKGTCHERLLREASLSHQGDLFDHCPYRIPTE